jgi:hypothetical protein
MGAHRQSKCVALLIYLTTALVGVVGQRHALAALPSGWRPGAHCTGSWVGPRAVVLTVVQHAVNIKNLAGDGELSVKRCKQTALICGASGTNDIQARVLTVPLCLIMHDRSMFSLIMSSLLIRQLGLESQVLCLPTLTWSVNYDL